MAIVSSSTTKAEEVRHFAGTITAFGVVVAILYFGRLFFITSIVALTIAFILEPFVGLLMRIRLPRAIASFVVCTAALLILYGLGLGAYAQLSGLMADMPRYAERAGQVVEDVRLRIETSEEALTKVLLPARQRQAELQRLAQQQAAEQARRFKKKSATEILPVPGIQEVRIHQDRNPITEYIFNSLSSVYQILLMISFVPFLVYFMLSWRDHINRSFLQMFHGEDRLIATRSLTGIADLVRAFVVGNFMLGLLLALITSVAFWLIHLPYPLLVGPLSGFCSLVPYVGLPLAMLPPLFVGLTAFSSLSEFALIMLLVAIFHLIAMNLLYPKIVGSRVHLNPLVVTFSLMLWGFLWDAPGLLLAIPLTAAIKAVCDNVKELRPYGKFLGD